MRNFLTATALVWPWLAGVFALPPPSGSESSDASRHITSVLGSTSGKEVSIRFETQCQGCFIGTEDGLVFALTVARAEAECGHISPQVNGVSLDGQWNQNRSRGHGVLQTKLVNGLGDREIYASWETLCIPDQAQLLSFTVHNIGQDKVREASGFTASFKQQGQPEILRLAAEPTDLEPKDVSLLDSWVAPSASQRLSVLPPEQDRDLDQILKDQFRQLAVLQAQARELEAVIHEKKNQIAHIIRQDFRSTIDACPGIKCVLQTTFRKVPKIIQLFANRFRHGRPASYQIHQSAANESRSLDKGFEDSNIDLFNIPQPLQSSEYKDGPGWPVPPNDDLAPPMTPPPELPGMDPPPPRPPGMWPPPPEMGPPPPPEPPGMGGPPRPPGMGPPPPGMGPPSPGPPGEELRPPPDHGRHGHRPPFPPHRHHHRHGPKILKRAVVIIIFATLATLLFRHLRHDPALFRRCCRRTADHACRREERRNRHTHRRAALHHQWSTWWNRYRRPADPADYNEKRNLILEQEGILEDVMQDELRALRSAHALVEEMYDAEEGRSRLYRAANGPAVSVAELDAAAAGASGRRRMGSAGGSSLDDLPLPPPPRYEEELEGDLTVVNGFQYTPSSRSVADDTSSSIVNVYTPDSSVVDCSPRVSSDTERTVVTRGEGRD